MTMLILTRILINGCRSGNADHALNEARNMRVGKIVHHHPKGEKNIQNLYN